MARLKETVGSLNLGDKRLLVSLVLVVPTYLPLTLLWSLCKVDYHHITGSTLVTVRDGIWGLPSR